MFQVSLRNSAPTFSAETDVMFPFFPSFRCPTVFAVGMRKISWLARPLL
jgi:hypothetical protein